MHFVKTLLWIVLALAVALFAIRNGEPVTVNLWSDLQMVTPLWVVVILSFLAGLLPALALHRTARWRWRRRLEQAERAAVATDTPELSADGAPASPLLKPAAGGAPVPPPVTPNG